jgi:hypothetical protein
MNRSQRTGVGVIAIFYGEVVAAPLLMLAILLRFHSNWYMLVRVPGATISLLLTVSVLEALVTTIAWFIFGLPLVAFWPLESMRRHLGYAYAAALPLGLVAPALLAGALFYGHHHDPRLPLMGRALFLETFGFMLVSSLVAINRYLKLAAQAEALIEAEAEVASRK